MEKLFIGSELLTLPSSGETQALVGAPKPPPQEFKQNEQIDLFPLVVPALAVVGLYVLGRGLGLFGRGGGGSVHSGGSIIDRADEQRRIRAAQGRQKEISRTAHARVRGERRYGMPKEK